ncbi:MAG: arginine deiminase family protein [Bacteroidales bacterium]|nr:arginine deiminase family protein [Bacteroidales bacterium]
MDYFRCVKPCVESEIGKLDYVILHAPGKEIEHMTPENAHKFLFSDILNYHEAMANYRDFEGSLRKVTNVLTFKDLLVDILKKQEVRENLVTRILEREKLQYLKELLDSFDVERLATVLIEGYENDSFYERYLLPPIPNLFFMRDAAVTMYNNIMISKMATDVRDRETMLWDAIFKNSSMIDVETINPIERYSISGIGSVEGGDVEIARHDIILSGCGARTSKEGIDAMVEHLRSLGGVRHLIMQQLPLEPDSFIHLDMVFTLLDRDRCMAYKPVIMNEAFKTIHYEVNGHDYTKISEEKNLVDALNKLGMPLEPVFCGGGDDYAGPREQWHSGANFFAFAPGKVLGYARNYNTIEALSKNGFDILKAADVASGKVSVDNSKRCVVAFEGNELCRGGGGARCMTMPILRQTV